MPVKNPWQMFGELAGSWRLVDAKSSTDKAFRIDFRTISRGSALVEIFGNPAKQVTQTIYHPSGETIMATHYCAQGNQPRLILSPARASDTIAFEFLDATNLKHPNDSYLIRIQFKFLANNHLERRETYTAHGVEEESVLQLKRSK